MNAQHDSGRLDNDAVAGLLDELAAILESQEAGPFRIRAYRDAADIVRSLDRPVCEFVKSGSPEELEKLPKIGKSLARVIAQLASTGTCLLLEQLRGAANPERALATVPGLGRVLAARIHDQLGLETLADLEAAAWDGRLRRVTGMGGKRIRAIRESLAGRFAGARRSAPLTATHAAAEALPSVAELLDVDAEYRRKAARGRLPVIAPRRFNPTHKAWLPILHTHCADRHYTALYSNTARAHELGTTNDWVVIYRDDHGGHGQWTVITAKLGPLRGRRIVRGREEECAVLYAAAKTACHV
jgi:hypothetical protein